VLIETMGVLRQVAGRFHGESPSQGLDALTGQLVERVERVRDPELMATKELAQMLDGVVRAKTGKPAKVFPR